MIEPQRNFEVQAVSDDLVRAGWLVKVKCPEGAPLSSWVIDPTGVTGIVTAANDPENGIRAFTVCVSGVSSFYCDNALENGAAAPATPGKAVEGNSVTLLGIRAESGDPLSEEGTSSSYSAGYLATGMLGVGNSYHGMFTVGYEGTDGSVAVYDGANPYAPAGLALINDQEHSIGVETFSGEDGYIYLLAVDPETTPTLEKDATMPTYEAGKCKILIARVIGGQIIQEHHGMIYGIIWGSC